MLYDTPTEADAMNRNREQGYEATDAWRTIQGFLPEENRITRDNRPEEAWWEWKGNLIHLDRYPAPRSAVKIILLHGVGGNGRLLSFMAVPLRRAGYEVIAPDLPGYGLNRMRDTRFIYDDWIEMIVDLVEAERADGRPVVLFGMSAGGMLAYQVACLHEGVIGLVATCLLDQRVAEVREGSAVTPFMGRIAIPLLGLLRRLFPAMRFPMKMVARMRAIVNDEGLLRILLRDRTSSGASVPVSFLHTLMTTSPAIEPEGFRRCPFLLVHPEKDRWTPVYLSRLFFDRLACDKKLVLLENAGHFPIERPGIGQMEEAVLEFLSGIEKRRGMQ
jgi:alpha-beta hydrolase superfamily lysophospholipase